MKSQGLPMQTIALIIIVVVVLAAVLIFFFSGFSGPKKNLSSTTDMATCQNYCLEAQNLAKSNWEPTGSSTNCNIPQGITLKFCDNNCQEKMSCKIDFDDGSSCYVNC